MDRDYLRDQHVGVHQGIERFVHAALAERQLAAAGMSAMHPTWLPRQDVSGASARIGVATSFQSSRHSPDVTLQSYTPTLDDLLAMSHDERDQALSKLSVVMASLIDEFPELTEFNSLDGEEFQEVGA